MEEDVSAPANFQFFEAQNGRFASVNAPRYQDFTSSTLSASIFTALPHVDPSLLAINRSALGCGSNEYRMGHIPGNADFPTFGRETLTKLKREIRSNGLGGMRKTHYHDFVYHAMASSVCTHDEATGAPTILEERYEAASNLSVFEMVAKRLVLLQSITVQAMQRWGDCNIAIPFGGMIMRPFETQLMMSQIALGAKRLGENMFSGFDSTIGFDQLSQHFSIQSFFHHCPVVEDPEKYVVMPFTRGGPRLGGKGNKMINQRDGARLFYDNVEGVNQAVDNVLADIRLPTGNPGRLDRMGDYTNFPVLQSYNTAVEGVKRRQIDIRGAFRPRDFLGRLDDSDDFLPQDDLHFDGQFVLDKVVNFQKLNVDFDPASLSHMQYAAIRADNHVCSQVDQIYYDATGKEARMASAHLWEHQGPGLAQREQSMAQVKTRTQMLRQKNQWLPTTGE